MSDFSSTTPSTLRRVLVLLGISILSILLVSYVLYQARNLIQGPSIVLNGEYFPEQHNKTVDLTGQTHNIVRLTVNGKEIHTDADGAFLHTIVLEHGYSIITLHAEDRFGRTTEVVREYVYVPEVST